MDESVEPKIIDDKSETLLHDKSLFVENLQKLIADPKNESCSEKCFEWLRKQNDPRLWEKFIREALENELYDYAEMAFVYSKDYNGIKLMSSLQNETDNNVRKGEVNTFLGKPKEAEACFRISGRRDLIRNLRKYFPSKQTTGWYSKDSKEDLTTLQLKAEDLLNTGRLSEASAYFRKLGDTENLLKSLVLSDDVAGLKSLAESLPLVPYNFDIFDQLTTILETLGMISDAIKLHLRRGNPVAAVKVALNSGQFQSAIELSKTYNVPIVSETLLQQTAKMIHTGDLMEAVKFLKLCGKTFAAGKILGMAALNELRTNNQPNLHLIKKLFTMASILLTTREEAPQESWSKKSRSSVKSVILEEIDLRFDESVPKHLRPTALELQWMRTNPWRGLHATQYLILVHQFIYKCHFYKATKIAHHLKGFIDILGNERVHAILALVSANGQNYFICSNAFYELSKSNHDFYEDVAADYFTSNEMNESSCRNVVCPRCETQLKDHHAMCPSCEENASICMITGEILTDTISVWTCGTCKGTISLRKHNRHKFCPVCHSTKQR